MALALSILPYELFLEKIHNLNFGETKMDLDIVDENVEAYLDLYILKPVKNIEEAQSYAITLSEEIKDCLNNTDSYDPDNYNYIVLVEANSMNGSNFSVNGGQRLNKKDKYFHFEKIVNDFHFCLHVWRIYKKNAKCFQEKDKDN